MTSVFWCRNKLNQHNKLIITVQNCNLKKKRLINCLYLHNLTELTSIVFINISKLYSKYLIGTLSLCRSDGTFVFADSVFVRFEFILSSTCRQTFKNVVVISYVRYGLYIIYVYI